MKNNLAINNNYLNSIFYWTKNINKVNFGDFLSDYVRSSLFEGVFRKEVLITGSIIDDNLMRKLDYDFYIFWGCGLRGNKKPKSDLLKKTVFKSFRGIYSAKKLTKNPKDAVVGDTALLLPIIYKPKGIKKNKTLFVPHYNEFDVSDDALLAESKCDELIRPNINKSYKDLEKFIDEICSYSFVLTRSLHVISICISYEVKFGILETKDNQLDIPFKWLDFFSGVNVMEGINKIKSSSLVDANIKYNELIKIIKIPSLEKMLISAPYKVKDEFVQRALKYDLNVKFKNYPIKRKSAAIYYEKLIKNDQKYISILPTQKKIKSINKIKKLFFY